MSVPSDFEILKFAISQSLSDVRVALPGIVTAYNSTTQRCTAKPTIPDSRIDPELGRVTEKLKPITEVPVIFPGNKHHRTTWPVEVGDGVLLVFASSSLDAWLASSVETADDQDDRHHHLTDAIAIPGLYSKAPTTAPSDALVVHSTSLKLGGPTAIDRLIKGDTYIGVEDTFLSALQTWVTAVSAATGLVSAGIAITAAFTAYSAARNTVLSNKVRTE